MLQVIESICMNQIQSYTLMAAVQLTSISRAHVSLFFFLLIMKNKSELNNMNVMMTGKCNFSFYSKIQSVAKCLNKHLISSRLDSKSHSIFFTKFTHSNITFWLLTYVWMNISVSFSFFVVQHNIQNRARLPEKR